MRWSVARSRASAFPRHSWLEDSAALGGGRNGAKLRGTDSISKKVGLRMGFFLGNGMVTMLLDLDWLRVKEKNGVKNLLNGHFAGLFQ